MTVDLDRLDALAAAATPGPWTHRPNHKPYHIIVFGGRKAYEAGYTTSDIEKADAAFIVALVNAYPELAKAVREREELRAAALAALREGHPWSDLRPAMTRLLWLVVEPCSGDGLGEPSYCQIHGGDWFRNDLYCRAALHREEGT